MAGYTYACLQLQGDALPGQENLHSRPDAGPGVVRSRCSRSCAVCTSTNPAASAAHDRRALVPPCSINSQPSGRRWAWPPSTIRRMSSRPSDPRPVRWPARSAGHLLQMRIVAGDVRRVAGNQIKTRALQRRMPVVPAFGEADVAQIMAGGIARATASAPGLASVASTCACGRSLASASAIAPLPVPRSASCATGLAAGAPAPARPAARFPDAGSAWPGRPPGPASRIRDGRSGRPPAHRPRGGPATPRRRPGHWRPADRWRARTASCAGGPVHAAAAVPPRGGRRCCPSEHWRRLRPDAGWVGLEGHAAIVEPSLCSAASGQPSTGSALQTGIRSGSAGRDKEGLSAPSSGLPRFPLSHRQLQDGDGEVQCLLRAIR